MKEFEIYFDDLTKTAQEALLAEFETTEKDENWDVFPLAIIERYEEGEEEEKCLKY